MTTASIKQLWSIQNVVDFNYPSPIKKQIPITIDQIIYLYSHLIGQPQQIIPIILALKPITFTNNAQKPNRVFQGYYIDGIGIKELLMIYNYISGKYTLTSMQTTKKGQEYLNDHPISNQYEQALLNYPFPELIKYKEKVFETEIPIIWQSRFFEEVWLTQIGQIF